MQIDIERERLPMWVVYDHPKDAPEHFVARLHYSLPEPKPTKLFVRADTLEEIRDWLSGAGYIKFDRDPKDDPVIVETWMV